MDPLNATLETGLIRTLTRRADQPAFSLMVGAVLMELARASTPGISKPPQ